MSIKLKDTIYDLINSSIKLQASRKLWGRSFDGTSDINGDIENAAGGIYIHFVNEINSFNNALYLNHRGTNNPYGEKSTGNIIALANGGSFLIGTSTNTGGNKLYVAGTIGSSITITSTGFIKSDSSNSYLLLGGGGHKAVSDFAISGHTHTKSQITDFSHTHDYLPLTGGTVTGNTIIRKTTSNSSTITTTSSVLNIGTGAYGHTGYHTGIAFNALHYGTYTDHIHAWIGLGPYTTTDTAECYPLVFAVNGSTVTNTAPTVRMTISPTGIVNVIGSLTVGGTAVSLNGHTHNYFSQNGGILNGNIIMHTSTPYTAYKSVDGTTYYGDIGYHNGVPSIWTEALRWKTIWHSGNLDPNSFGGSYLPLAGGAMSSGARISASGGNLLLGNSNNAGWVQTQDICSQTATGDTYWSIRQSGAAHFTTLYIGGDEITFTT